MKPTTLIAAILLAGIVLTPQTAALIPASDPTKQVSDPEDLIQWEGESVPSCEAADGIGSATMLSSDSLRRQACEAGDIYSLGGLGDDDDEDAPAGGTQELLDTVLSLAPDGAGAMSMCHPTNTVCAMAGSDSHIERINNGPNMGYVATMGGGWSNVAIAGTAVIVTSLGSDSCRFEGNSGCYRSWSNISNGGCTSSKADTTATLDTVGLSAHATWWDPTCNPR